jgi:hypothetical protein
MNKKIRDNETEQTKAEIYKNEFGATEYSH